MHTLSFLLVALVGSALAIQIRFNATVATHCKNPVGPECTFDWNDPNIWLEGIVPSTKDDVLVIAPEQKITLSCSTKVCSSQSVFISTKILSVLNSSPSTFISNDVKVNGSLTVTNGAFNATKVVLQGSEESALSLLQTTSSIFELNANHAKIQQSSLKVIKLSVKFAILDGAKLDVIEQLSDVHTLAASSSEFAVYGSCKNSVYEGYGQYIENSKIFSTTKCQLPIGKAQTTLVRSSWLIAALENEPKDFLLPSNIGLRLSHSDIKLQGDIVMHINTAVNLATSKIGTFDASKIVLLSEGSLSGDGSFPELIAKGGLLDVNEADMVINGKLSLDQNVAIRVTKAGGTFNNKNIGNIYCKSLELNNPSLTFPYPVNLPFVFFNNNQLTGSFGKVTMGNLNPDERFEIEYANADGYVGANLIRNV